MAVLAIVGAVAGAGVAAAAGASILTGLQIGWFIGSMLTPKPDQKNFQEPSTDLRVTGTEYGQCIPWVQGHPRISGQVWWASAKRPIPHYTVTEGGKGGGGDTVSLHYTYEVDIFFGLTSNEILGISRIWKNGKLIYTALTSADPSSIIASAATDEWTRMTVYTGASDQQPDPTYEAAVGAGNAPGYRHRSGVFFEGLQLGAKTQIDNYTFEVLTKGTAGQVVASTRLYHFNNALIDAAGSGVSAGLHGDVALTAAEMKFGIGAVGESVLQGQWYIDIDDSGTGHFNFGTSDFTLDIQVYWNAFPDGTVTGTSDNRSYAVIFAGGALSGGTSGITLDANGKYTLLLSAGSDELIWQHRNTSGVTRQMTCANPFDLDEWTHVAVIRLGTTLYVTVGGVAVMSMSVGATDAITSGGSAELTIGGTADANRSYQLSGYVDEFRVVDGLGGWNTIPFEPPLAEYTGSDLSGDTWTLADEDVQDVVERICARSGLPEALYDASQLSTITRQVRALAVSQITSPRQTLEVLASAFFFEVTVSDKLYFVPRGGASVATIPYEHLGASLWPFDKVDPINLRDRSEIEIPAQIALTYNNVSADYHTDTQLSDRLISGLANSVREVRIGMGFTPAEAKGITNTMLLDMAASMIATKISILGDYAKIEPTDPFVATDADGNTFRFRAVQRTDNFPVLEYDVVLDDTSVLQDQGITDVDYTPQTVVDAPAVTLLEMMDIPILRDADDEAGPYAAAKGQTTPWPGAALLKSTDDIEFEQTETFTESAVFGDCTTTLGNWTGPRIFDEVNSVTVDVGDGTLSSSTRAAILNSKAVNAMLIGSEIIQFRTATLVATGIYTLTGLLRGCRGTTWAMTGHAASERCVLLRMAGLRKVELQNNELGVSKYWRAVTLGRRLSTADSELFTCDGIGLKPFAPWDLRAARDGSNNITFTMQRRTRYSVRLLGPLGISVPLGEDSADFELDITTTGSPDSVIRTIQHDSVSGTLVTFSYSAAQQTTDGFTPGDPVNAIGYQLSETVGRGYAHERTV